HPNYGPVRLNSISYRTSNASHPRISFTLLPPLSPFPPASASSPPAAAGPGPGVTTGLGSSTTSSLTPSQMFRTLHDESNISTSCPGLTLCASSRCCCLRLSGCGGES
ncbi:hypothetical protein NQZ68_028286, partial [Dissostichus eleginoides]